MIASLFESRKEIKECATMLKTDVNVICRQTCMWDPKTIEYQMR